MADARLHILTHSNPEAEKVEEERKEVLKRPGIGVLRREVTGLVIWFTLWQSGRRRRVHFHQSHSPQISPLATYDSLFPPFEKREVRQMIGNLRIAIYCEMSPKHTLILSTRLFFTRNYNIETLSISASLFFPLSLPFSPRFRKKIIRDGSGRKKRKIIQYKYLIEEKKGGKRRRKNRKPIWSDRCIGHEATAT